MDINQEQAAINRRQRIAEMLMAQGQEPLETNQVAGGYVVPVSPLAGVAKVAQQLAGAYAGKKADESQSDLERRQKEELTSIDLSAQDAPNRLLALGRVSEALAAQKNLKEPKNREGVPTGFVQNEDGSIAPMPIQGGKNYMDYQLELASQKAQIPSYGEPQRLQMAQEDQAMQREAMARAEDAAARQRAAFERQQELDAIKLEQAKKESAAGPKLTEGQAKASTFASQMITASDSANKIEQAGFNPVDFQNQLKTMMAGGATNALASAQAQQYKQAQNQWAESFLRIKTGAAATPEEVELNVKTFFPQLGDSPEVIQQKAAARKQAEQDVLSMAGPGAAAVESRNSPVIDIKDPANDTPEVRAAIAADIAKDQKKPKVIKFDANGNPVQ